MSIGVRFGIYERKLSTRVLLFFLYIISAMNWEGRRRVCGSKTLKFVGVPLQGHCSQNLFTVCWCIATLARTASHLKILMLALLDGCLVSRWVVLLLHSLPVNSQCLTLLLLWSSLICGKSWCFCAHSCLSVVYCPVWVCLCYCGCYSFTLAHLSSPVTLNNFLLLFNVVSIYFISHHVAYKEIRG